MTPSGPRVGRPVPARVEPQDTAATVVGGGVVDHEPLSDLDAILMGDTYRIPALEVPSPIYGDTLTGGTS